MYTGIKMWATIGVLILAPTPLDAQEVIELPRNTTEVGPDVAPLYQIGGFEATGWDTFGNVSQVSFDQDGNLYVLDRQTMQVSVVSPEGRLLSQFGERGEGPGEFRSPGTMGVTRDGRVFVQDAGHRAYLEFDAQGEFVQQVPMVVEGGTVIMGALKQDPTGPRFLTSSGGGFMMITRESIGGPDDDAFGMPRGRPIDRVEIGEQIETSPLFRAWDPPEPEPSSGGGGTMVAGRRISMPQSVIWEPRLFYEPLPDGGVAVVDSSAYAVKIVDARGTLVRTLVRPSVSPTRVTERIKEREIQRRVDQIESGGGPQMRIVTNDGSGSQEVAQDAIRRMQVERLRESPFWPEIPVVGALAVGWDGLIWVEQAQIDPDEDGPIDLFRADGGYAGTIPANHSVRIPSAFGPNGMAAWVERDEFDVPTIRVARLSAGLR